MIHRATVEPDRTSTDHPTRPATSVASELALLLTSLALVFGFSRVFVDRSYFWRVAAFSVVAPSWKR